MAELQFLIMTWLGMSFVASSTVKLRAMGQFQTAIAGYGLLSSALITPMAWLVVAAELILGCALLVGWHANVALRLVACLLLVFGVAMGVPLVQGRRPSCGCGLGAVRTVGWSLVERDVAMSVVAVATSLRPDAPGLGAILHSSTSLPRDSAVAGLITLVIIGLVSKAVSVGLRVRTRLQVIMSARR